MDLRNGSGRWLLGAIVCGALITLIGIIDFTDVEGLGGEIDVTGLARRRGPVRRRLGAYLVIAGGGALAAAAVMLRINSD